MSTSIGDALSFTRTYDSLICLFFLLAAFFSFDSFFLFDYICKAISIPAPMINRNTIRTPHIIRTVVYFSESFSSYKYLNYLKLSSSTDCIFELSEEAFVVSGLLLVYTYCYIA